MIEIYSFIGFLINLNVLKYFYIVILLFLNDVKHFEFISMHLADTFNQSDLQHKVFSSLICWESNPHPGDVSNINIMNLCV